MYWLERLMPHELPHCRMLSFAYWLHSSILSAIHDIGLPGTLFFFYSLYYKAPLDPPANFRGHSLNSRSIELSWGQVPKYLRYGTVLGFHLACLRLNSTEEHSVNLPSAKLNWMFKGLRKFTSYSCRLRAYDRFGNGTWSKKLVISTDEDGMSDKIVHEFVFSEISLNYWMTDWRLTAF